MKQNAIFSAALILLICCSNPGQQKISAKAINDSVLNLTKQYHDTSKFKEAISLLEQAIKLDSNYYESYTKLFFFQTTLGDFRNASKTATQLIKFKPDSADLYFQRGLFKELANDTISSKSDFSKAILLYSHTLDTMNKKNPYWLLTWKTSALCLIMAGQEKIIHDYLKENCTTALDSSFYDVEILTQSREELLQIMKTKYILN